MFKSTLATPEKKVHAISPIRKRGAGKKQAGVIVDPLHCIALHVASRIAAIGHMRYLFLRRLEMIRHIRYLRPLPPISQIADQTRPPFSHLRWDPKQYAGRPKYYLIPSKKAKKQKPSVDYAGQIDTRAYTLTQGSHLMIRPTTGGHSCVGYRSGLAMASRGK